MRKLFFTILLVIITFSAYVVFAEETTGWMPKWNVGDWWIMQRLSNVGWIVGVPEDWVGPISYKYTVKETQIIDGQEYFVLEVKDLEEKENTIALAFYSKENFRLLKIEFYRDGKKSNEEKYYNKYRQYPCPVVIPNVFSLPVFPIDTKQNSKQQFRIEYLDETYTQEVKIISASECKSIIDSTIPKTSTKSSIVTLAKEGKPGIGSSKVIDNVKDKIYEHGDVFSGLQGECLYIILEERSKFRFNKATNSDEYRTDRVIQIWNVNSPWPLYIETPGTKYYLGSISK